MSGKLCLQCQNLLVARLNRFWTLVFFFGQLTPHGTGIFPVQKLKLLDLPVLVITAKWFLSQSGKTLKLHSQLVHVNWSLIFVLELFWSQLKEVNRTHLYRKFLKFLVVITILIFNQHTPLELYEVTMLKLLSYFTKTHAKRRWEPLATCSKSWFFFSDTILRKQSKNLFLENN